MVFRPCDCWIVSDAFGTHTHTRAFGISFRTHPVSAHRSAYIWLRCEFGTVMHQLRSIHRFTTTKNVSCEALTAIITQCVHWWDAADAANADSASFAAVSTRFLHLPTLFLLCSFHNFIRSFVMLSKIKELWQFVGRRIWIFHTRNWDAAVNWVCKWSQYIDTSSGAAIYLDFDLWNLENVRNLCESYVWERTKNRNKFSHNALN